MKKGIIFLLFCVFIQGVAAQKNHISVDATIQTLPKKDYFGTYPDADEIKHVDAKNIYFDVNVGYLPKKENASWAGQISGGYCFNEQSAVGIALGAWGREQVFRRQGVGLGMQYRHNYPKRLLIKAEFGYLLMPKMHDGTMDKEMMYLPDLSKPIYFKLEAQWRLWRLLTLGIAATQSGDLYFERYVDNTRTKEDLWRINALTLQLGLAFDRFALKSK